MLAQVAGFTIGSARRINPIIVRAARLKTSVEDYLIGLNKILADKKDTGKAVLVFATYWPKNRDDGTPMFSDGKGGDGIQAVKDTMARLLNDLAKKGVLTVTGSGNVRSVSLKVQAPRVAECTSLKPIFHFSRR